MIRRLIAWFLMVRVVRLKPNDVIVAETPEHLSESEAARMRAVMQQMWPNHRVLICDGGTTLKAVRAQDIEHRV